MQPTCVTKYKNNNNNYYSSLIHNVSSIFDFAIKNYNIFDEFSLLIESISNSLWFPSGEKLSPPKSRNLTKRKRKKNYRSNLSEIVRIGLQLCRR